MQEIKCPKCGEVFQVDESGYAAILKQVRDKEYHKEIEEYKKHLEESQESKDELVKAKTESEYKDIISSKDAEIEKLKAKLKEADNEKKIAVDIISDRADLDSVLSGKLTDLQNVHLLDKYTLHEFAIKVNY